MNLLESLYGRPYPVLRHFERGSTLIPGVEATMRQRDEILAQLRENLHKTQNHMKDQADKPRREQNYEV